MQDNEEQKQEPNRIYEATEKDWEDFWYNEDKPNET
jgi:hypothetical protein|tara:strand:- start:615 stop:722 length:108 start_codon:yes stop_codon:yes gene_type:complete